MASRRKTVIVAGSILALAVLGAALVVRVLVNPDRYRVQVISFLEKATGKQIEIGHIGVNWIPLSVRIDNLGVRNAKPFPAAYVLKTARVDASLDARELLHRRVVIKSLVLHDPVINVISDPDGLWNFENPPSPTQKRAPSFALGVISLVVIENGEVFGSSLIDPADRPGPVVLEVHGLGGQLEQLNFDAFLGSSSSKVAHGDMAAASLRFGSVTATKVKCKLQLQAREVSIDHVKADLYGGVAEGALSFNLSGKTPTFKTDARLNRVNLDHLLLAAFPSAHGKIMGTMEGDIKLAGPIEHTFEPLAAMHGTGHVTVRNGRAPTLMLNQNLMKLTHFNNLGPAKEDASSFASISADMELTHQRISSKNVDVDGYGLDVDAAGMISVSGSDDLAYEGIAAITTKQGFFTTLAARISGATVKDGKISFPFRVSGTVANPIFTKGRKEH